MVEVVAVLMLAGALARPQEAEPAAASTPLFTVRGPFVATPSRAEPIRCRRATATDGTLDLFACIVDAIDPRPGQRVAAVREWHESLNEAVRARIGPSAFLQWLSNRSSKGVGGPFADRPSFDLAFLFNVDPAELRGAPLAGHPDLLARLFLGLEPGGVVVVIYAENPAGAFRFREPAGELLDTTLHDFVCAGFVPGRRWLIGDGEKPIVVAEFTRPAADAERPWWDLFNGRDLAGWSHWLGAPHDGGPPLGAADPRRVFTVVEIDGEPAIRVSGEVWGLLETVDDYADFELEVDFKWGTRVWPPLNARDSGLLYRAFGEQGVVAGGGGALSGPPGSGWFPRCFEMQITEGDTGSFYSLGDVVVDARGQVGVVAAGRSEDRTRPGEWSRLTIRVAGDEAVHLVNGTEVVRVTKLRRAGPAGEPVTTGRFGLQSESAEIFFRRIRIRPLAGPETAAKPAKKV